MPKDVKIQKGIASERWLVYESYEFSSKKISKEKRLRNNQGKQQATNNPDKRIELKTIVQYSHESTGYYLSNTSIYEDLLVDFLKIHDDLSALNYVKERGLLDDRDLGVSVADEDENGVLQITFHSQKGCFVDEIIDAADYLSWINQLSILVSDRNTSVLKNFIEEKSAGAWLEVFVRCKNRIIYPFETVETDGITFLTRCDEMTLSYPESEWKRLGSNKYLYVAQDYLRKVFFTLLRGVQPILEWSKNTNGENVLDESLWIRTPWQAICYALFLSITKKGNLVSCLNCSNRFQGGRQDKRFCSPACSRMHSRKYGQTVHSYKKLGKETR